MKRIVVCPSCKIKMQIFDIGKEINQKCPRCQNSFDIHPAKAEGKGKNEGAKEQPQAEGAPVVEAPQTETPEVKEAPTGADQPAEKKIMVKPPTPSALKSTPAADEKPAADTTDATGKSADTKPADEVKQDDGEKPALASTKPTGFVKKSAAAPKPTPTALPTSEPRVEPPLAGFSKMQFMILLVLLLVAIIIQVVFAKNQMKQISVINDNLKVIHSKL